MKIILNEIDVDIDCLQDITVEEINNIIENQYSSYDAHIKFINYYFRREQWWNDKNELLNMAERLDKDAIKTMKRLIKAYKEI